MIECAIVVANNPIIAESTLNIMFSNYSVIMQSMQRPPAKNIYIQCKKEVSHVCARKMSRHEWEWAQQPFAKTFAQPCP
jgi:hypothetical protein